MPEDDQKATTSGEGAGGHCKKFKVSDDRAVRAALTTGSLGALGSYGVNHHQSLSWVQPARSLVEPLL
jgi:hypothetical protein